MIRGGKQGRRFFQLIIQTSLCRCMVMLTVLDSEHLKKISPPVELCLFSARLMQALYSMLFGGASLYVSFGVDLYFPRKHLKVVFKCNHLVQTFRRGQPSLPPYMVAPALGL